MSSTLAEAAPTTTGTPKLGFLGLGWIGRHRMSAISNARTGRIHAFCEPADDSADAALECAPDAERVDSLDALLESGIDGLVIATPSALHVDQSVRALEHGVAVFCQKPLGRTTAENRRVIDAARAADRLLDVDLSYRYLDAVKHVGAAIRQGELGEVYAIDVVFHNAYGPDKAWYRDPLLSGGGCVLDLGIHMVDLALWMLDFPRANRVASRLYAGGHRIAGGSDSVVEDYAVATVDLDSGATLRMACSWNLPAGQDAVIEASFYGSRAGAVVRNVNGSFYDFVGEILRGTSRERVSEPPDAWGGRAAVDWAERLARGGRFDPAIERLVVTAEVLDGILGR